MLKLIKLIICIQCFVLLKAIDDGNEPAADDDYDKDVIITFGWINCSTFPPVLPQVSDQQNASNYLQEAPDNFTIERSIRYKWIFDHFDIKKNKTIQQFNTPQRIQRAKDKLYVLDEYMITKWVDDIRVLVHGVFYYKDNKYSSIWGCGYNSLQQMIGNRILFFKENLHELLQTKSLSMEVQQKVLNAHKQLLPITKEYIRDLWSFHTKSCGSFKDWYTQTPKTLELEFVELIENIFAPFVNGDIKAQDMDDLF